MARHKGPKHKLSRRAGVNLTGTTSENLARRLQEPARHGRRRPQRQSEYAERLRAKQRVKLQYGVMERQFRRFFKNARGMPGPSGENLLKLLERRLDSVVYRLGFGRTRPMSRQLVSHGHTLVNGRRVDIPSYLVKPGDVISLGPKALANPVIKENLQTPHTIIPPWLARDGATGRVMGEPRREDIDADIREDLIVEFYAR